MAFLPLALKKIVYRKFFGYTISKSARIGFSFINIDQLVMDPGSIVGNFNFIGNFDALVMKYKSKIHSFNWLTGFSTTGKSRHFAHQPSRKSLLSIGCHSAITKYHHFDVTNVIQIGQFTTIAGYNSVFLTHSININKCIQDSSPIIIGDYCFVGSNCMFLGNACLPNYCVLGAKSLLSKPYVEEFSLYAGLPAKRIKSLDKSALYFHRKIGYVW